MNLNIITLRKMTIIFKSSTMQFLINSIFTLTDKWNASFFLLMNYITYKE